MRITTSEECQDIVDYMASQARDESVEFQQKVYSENLHGVIHDIWDVHTN